MNIKPRVSIGIIILNTIIWYSIYTNGFFVTITWIIILAAIVGIWLRVSGRA